MPADGPCMSARRGCVLALAAPQQQQQQVEVERDATTESESGVAALKLPGLRKEVGRRQSRVLKKVAKASQKLRAAEAQVESLLADESTDLAALERCPDTVTIQGELEALREELKGLNELATALEGVKNASDPKYADICLQAQLLNVGDSPPERPPRGPKKVKGKAPPPRKPYWVYTSADGIEIRVGRGASDNDLLSCNPEHRDGPDWWMHVAGYPGSHIVIRCHDNDVPMETLTDAATLAAKYSKGPQKGKVGVNVVRCRQVSKPPGAKPGLVRLSGEVSTLKVNVKTESERLSRLEETKSTASMDGSIDDSY